MSAFICPNCQARLKVATPVQPGRALSCPKCGHAIQPGGEATEQARQRGLLLVLIGAVVVIGAGIITALIMTRGPARSEPGPLSSEQAMKDTLESLAGDLEKKRTDTPQDKASAEKASAEKARRR